MAHQVDAVTTITTTTNPDIGPAIISYNCKPFFSDYHLKRIWERCTIGFTRWIEKMENVIDNSGCAENQKVRYAASSLVNKALTWWNTQVQVRGCEAAMAMTRNNFKALMVEEFCPSNEMEKLENKF
ncbi:hypothetical protein Tco_1315937 [Tanacetum coccineum]